MNERQSRRLLTSVWTCFDGQANWDKRHSVLIRLGYRLVITWQISSASCTSITLKDKEKHPLNQKQAFLTTAVTAAAEQQVPGDCVHRAYTSLALTTRRRRKYAQVWRSRLPSLKITGLFWRQPVTQCGASSPQISTLICIAGAAGAYVCIFAWYGPVDPVTTVC